MDKLKLKRELKNNEKPSGGVTGSAQLKNMSGTKNNKSYTEKAQV